LGTLKPRSFATVSRALPQHAKSGRAGDPEGAREPSVAQDDSFSVSSGSSITSANNLDLATVKGFGQEWSTFTQHALSDSERQELFSKYFRLIEWSKRPRRCLDMGCGSGRWAVLVAPLVDELVAADASREALEVARRNVQAGNVSFVEASPESLPFPDGHFDLIFSLGVLHHLPDTAGAIHSLARKLRPGGTLLLYLYYAFDTSPAWFRALWKVTDLVRWLISRAPFPLRYGLSQIIAVLVYWPWARAAKYLPVPDSWPLKFYACRSFYCMRTDALDRFGTRLEKRFTRPEIAAMLNSAGLAGIRFSDAAPYWVCTAIRPTSAPA
jgi:SAM-dependent methyltransferase